MKKIKLLFLQIEYYFNYYFGYYMVNERKYTRYLKDLIELQTKIQELRADIKSKN